MAVVTEEGRFLASGDESGTAPEDRGFRPDVEGLRAIAVLLVVLFHSGVSALSGGFVGVDVFFVISGFVITGVLLRERTSTGKTSIASFYGRRARRIIPAATLVIIATVFLAYGLLGIGGGIPTASDGRWAAVFLANFHFVSTGTNYLTSTQPPSPLQNFWSLAVEEQFYLVYAPVFLLIASLKVLSFRARLAIGLVAVICASLAFSIVDTQNNPTSAFFSPFTRAWELAIGALIAVAAPWILKAPERVAAIATWLGIGAIAFAAVKFTSLTPYPGSAVIIPVIGSALIIAGGTAAPALGVETLLHLPPFRWLGKISYSLYLWHWPILIIAAEYAGKTTLSVKDNLGWDLVALVVSIGTYLVLENPIRHARFLRRNRWASIALGIVLVGVTLGAITLRSSLAVQSGPSVAKTKAAENELAKAPPVPLKEVLSAVAASNSIRDLPGDLIPSLTQILAEPQDYIGFPTVKSGCDPRKPKSTVPACVYGDRHGKKTMILYGDSHAGMWFKALNKIAQRAHWRFVVLFKFGCPPTFLSVPWPGNATGDWTACDAWHRYAVDRIKKSHPAMLIISEASKYPAPNGVAYTPQQWQDSMQQLLAQLKMPKTKTALIGSPAAPRYEGPACLSRHMDDVQACSGPPDPVYVAFNNAEQRAAAATGTRYIDVLPWFCAKTCSFVVTNQEVYQGRDHVTTGYSYYLKGALQQALEIPKLPISH